MKAEESPKVEMQIQGSLNVESNNLNIQRDAVKKKTFTSIQGYALHEILGKGSFGQVFRATKDGKTVAIKMIDKALIRKKKLQRYVNNEVKVMRELKNPNTVRLFEAFEDKEVLYLVMECCNQGTLFNHILKNKPEEKECIRIFAQIMKGFIEIHEKHILHRDLKPSNIFIKDGIYKIADFGLALPKAVGQSQCGTSYFMAPEILQKKIHDYKVDLWSMGVILFFMIFREYPFKNAAHLLEEIQEKTNPSFDYLKCLKHPEQIKYQPSPSLVELFRRIFVVDPICRISFKELYSMEIFSEYFSPDELLMSSRIYTDLEKCKPIQQDGQELSNQSEEDQTSKSKDDHAKTKKSSLFKPSIKHTESLHQKTFQNDSLNNIEIANKEESLNKNGEKGNNLGAEELNKVGLTDEQINSVGLTDEQINKELKTSSSKDSSQENEDERFEEEQGVNDDDQPEIEMKNISSFQSFSKKKIVHQFGPKVFFQSSILPKSKFKRPEDDSTIPNQPSTCTSPNKNYTFYKNWNNTYGQSFNTQIEDSTHPSHQKYFNKDKSITANTETKGQLALEQEDEEEEEEEEAETENKRDIEQDNKDQPISYGNEDLNEQDLKKMPFRKGLSFQMNVIDQAVKSKNRKQMIEDCDPSFEIQLQVYLYEIGIYNIVGDTIDSLNVLNMGSSTQSIVNYLLAKLLLFLANKLMNSLHNAQNIFNLQHFDKFVVSTPSKLLLGKINRDIEQWSMKFSLFYYGIDYEHDIQSEEVRKIVTEDITETDFDSQLKIPIRLVLDLIFKSSYKMGKACHSPRQAQSILRTALYILICMLINYVFDKDKVKDFLYFYFKDPKQATATSFDFASFSLWSASASKEALLNQIHHLIKLAFGERKLYLLQTKL